MRNEVAKALTGRLPPPVPRHYIAYNKVEDWGPVPEGGSTFAHWSGKSKSFLEKTLAENVWVISGERVGPDMVYKLCHVFSPRKISRAGRGYRVSGPGAPFIPHVDVTRKRWMANLLKEQVHFSHGLNKIQSRSIIDALLRLKDSLTEKPAGVPKG